MLVSDIRRGKLILPIPKNNDERSRWILLKHSLVFAILPLLLLPVCLADVSGVLAAPVTRTTTYTTTETTLLPTWRATTMTGTETIVRGYWWTTPVTITGGPTPTLSVATLVTIFTTTASFTTVLSYQFITPILIESTVTSEYVTEEPASSPWSSLWWMIPIVIAIAALLLIRIAAKRSKSEKPSKT
jgi:hypothetical protein